MPGVKQSFFCINTGNNIPMISLKRHPEINEGWVEYCTIFQEYNNKLKDVQNCMPWNKNSIHWEDADRMGRYRIEYEDGTNELYDIYWGLNIGIILADWYDQSGDLSVEDSGVLEPTYTCDYEMVDNRAYYKLLIPLKKKQLRLCRSFWENTVTTFL